MSRAARKTPAVRGRRPAVDPCVARLHLSTTPAHKVKLAEAAKAAGMTITSYLLSHLPGSEQKPDRPAATADLQTLVKVLDGLGKLGSDFNQLARARNTTGQDPAPEELRRIRVALETISGEVQKALGYAD